MRPSEDPPTEQISELQSMLRLGRLPDLESRARALTQAYPRSGQVWRMLGVALHLQGQDGIACLLQAVALDPLNPRTHGDLALAQLAIGRPDQALASIDHALQLDPALAEAHSTRGIALLEVGRIEDAAAAFERALVLRPGFTDALSNLAIARRLQGRADEAIASARRVLEMKPASGANMIVAAEAHADKGEFPQAEAMLRQAIALDPGNPEALAALVRVRAMTAEDEPWLASARRIVSGRLTPRKEVMLRFALGKCLDDLKRYDEAFEEYRRANEISRAHRPRYDPDRQQRLTDGLIRTFSPDWVQGASEHGVASRKPVFVIGMPRSGTSLIEQILASHPSVFGAGELTFWQASAARCDGNPAVLAASGEIAAQYLRQLDSLAPAASHVIDKMPDNFRYLGLIHAALPCARVIHIRRDPVDTCLSIYFQDFKMTLDYASSLDDLAHFYGEYVRLMRHWRTVMPTGSMLEVSYEDLVVEPERWTREMLQFLGLNWEPRCLDFQNTFRSVLTASRWQVRQKINRSSIARWRHYERHLGPLLALTDLN